MAVHPHATGGYRAYKKINGIEYQLYAKDENKALALQSQLDKKKRELSSLRSPQYFCPNDKLTGIGIRYLTAKKSIVLIAQFTVNGKQVKRQKTYKGRFEQLWQFAIAQWRAHFNIDTQDYIDMTPQIKKAKRQYIQELGLLEERIK
ncbi:hypothetical protein [Thalassotalea sp. PLHSN55]|uniref:hypothetical protein n=1 Tax=Thalassotalea sp. PLHSN55 TaxID=3435888 RepID=UPI003F8440E2